MDCPKCLALRKMLDEQTVGCCQHCGRWQFLYQGEFEAFADPLYRHLACDTCHRLGAWCLDMKVMADPTSQRCAYKGHVHRPGACPEQPKE